MSPHRFPAAIAVTQLRGTLEAYRAVGVETSTPWGGPLREEADRFGEPVPPRLSVERSAPAAKPCTRPTPFDRDFGGKAANG